MLPRLDTRGLLRLISSILGIVWLAAGAQAAGAGTEHEFEARGGIGYDSNAFLTPSDPYVDQFTETTVDPDRRSGMFVPLSVRGDSWIVSSTSRFGIAYTARGRLYPASDLDNANEAFLRVEPGMIRVFGREASRENTLRVSPRFTYNKEVFFDRDTGLDSDLGGRSLADRYTYTALGIETEYRIRTLQRFEWDIGLLYESRDYENLTGVSSLDHDRIDGRAEVEIELADAVALELEVEYQIRDYDERQARTLDGELLSINDSLKYRYLEAGATLRLRPSKQWWIYLDAGRRDRTDEFVGYNDYTQDSFRVRAVYDRGTVRVRAAVRHRQRDYDRGFIFDLPENPADLTANPLKHYETLDVDLRVEVPFGRPGWRAFGDLDYRDQETTDPRYTYAREEIAIGLSWEF